MDLITLDMETFYSSEFTLSKLTTEEYIRHRDFETIMCGFKINAGQTYWVDGPDVAAELAKLRIAENAVLCHHAHFDGLILSHHYGQYQGLVRHAVHGPRRLRPEGAHGARCAGQTLRPRPEG